MASLDDAFLALPLAELDDAALARARALGASAAELRVEEIRDQRVALRDGEIEGVSDDVELGAGVRVVVDGSMGFAATVELDPASITGLVDLAVASARRTAAGRARPVELAPEPAYGAVEFVADFDVDPTGVPLADRVALLRECSAALLGAPGVDHVASSLHGVNENKHLATLEGTVANQRRVRVHPVVEVLAVTDGDFETMRTIAPPAGRGYEHLTSPDGFLSELDELPELLAAKLAAPSVEPGAYDLVIDPSNLWLTIHESIGHATELDRALGYEAAYAGTSFATPDGLGTLAYGSALMNVQGDRTTPGALATIGFDDEGVAAQSFPIVRDGVFAGYQLDRQFAAEAGVARSNGCAYGCSPFMAPIQRMANVSLASSGPAGPTTGDLVAGVARGVLVVGDKSWSIDMQRYNFQFTGQRFFLIRGGRIAGQLRDVAYQATTTQFWGSLVALGGDATYVLGGAMNCGKGQPSQVAPVGHGCPSAVFEGVRVLNTKRESGR